MSTTLKTTNIKGKQYVEVSTRLKHFRENFAGWSLETELVNVNDETALIRAVIRNPEGMIAATGTAYERKDAPASLVNKTSHVENCETSAWGRALGNLGIGIDSSVASADEVEMAIANQTPRTASGDLVEVEPDEWLHRTEIKNTAPKAKPLPAKPDIAPAGDIIYINELCKETKTNLGELYKHFGVVNSAPNKTQALSMIESLKMKLSKQLDQAATKSAA